MTQLESYPAEENRDVSLGSAVRCANIILVSLIALSILCLAYAIYTGQFRSALSRNLYIGLFVGIMVASVLLMRSSNTRKVNIVLSFVSVLLALYIVEFALFLFPHKEHLSRAEMKKTRQKLAEKEGVIFDPRTPEEFLQSLRQRGRDAYPRVAAVNLINGGFDVEAENLLPVGGIAEKTIVHCREAGQFRTFQSDEHGFNNPLGLYGGKAIDMVLIGDSFTQGVCVKPEENIAGVLTDMGYTVVNVGNDGNGPLVELMALIEYATILKPRVVLWFYTESNDLTDLPFEKQQAFIMRYVNENFTQGLVQRQPEIDHALRQFLDEVTEKRARVQTELTGQKHKKPRRVFATLVSMAKLSSLRTRFGLIPFVATPPPAPPFALFTEILARAKATVASWAGKLYVVYLPAWERYAGQMKREAFYRDRVLSIIEDVGIPLIDIHTTFTTHADPLALFPYRFQGHYTAEGYRLVAETVRAAVGQIEPATPRSPRNHARLGSP